MKKFLVVVFISLVFMPIGVSAQRGCCSHHGGVAGCSSSGRQICNDGTLSPTCTCTPVVNYIYGCTDEEAKNYNSRANKDNGSCVYYKYGCTDENAKNYDETAEKSDNSCEYYIEGCTDEDAENYDGLAEKDDGSCEYDTELVNANEESIETKEDESDDSNVGLGILGIGGILTGYLYNKSKNK